MATEANKEIVSKENNNHENDFDKKDDNPFIELVNKKIRKANKKMQRIIALKAQIKEKNAAINEDQQRLLASEEGTSTLLRELEELRLQMLKVSKESSPQTSEASKKKEKEKKKKQETTKKEKEAPSKAPSKAPAEKQATHVPAPSQPAPVQEQATPTTPEAPKTVEATPAPAPAPSTSQPAPVSPPVQEHKEEPKAEVKKEEPTASGKEEDKSSEKETEESAEFSSAAEVRAEWKAQKDIYLQKFKHTFGPQHENKYIAVHKGILYGPCDTLQELKEAQGGDKLPGAFLARVGHEDEQPVPRRQGRSGYRGGRGRGGGGNFRNGRGRGGRGRGDRT